MLLLASLAVSISFGVTTGSSSSSVRLAPGPTSVTDFGAKGDGSSDDTNAIQAAIDSLPVNIANIGILTPKGFANGGVLFIPRGRYKITATLKLKRGIRIIGESRESSQIVSFQRGSVLQYLDAGRYSPDEIGIENLSVWQDPSVAADSGAAIEVNVGPATVQSVSFRGTSLHLEGTYRGLLLAAGIGCSLRDTFISKTISHGIHVEYQPQARTRTVTTSTTFENVYSNQSKTGDGFRIESAAYISLISCASDSNFRHGYSFEGGATLGILASGAELNGDSGLLLRNTTAALVSINVYAGSGRRHGLTLDGAAHTTIIGSHFTSSNSTGYAINITARNGRVVSVGSSFVGAFANAASNIPADVLDLADLSPDSTQRLRSGKGSPEGIVAAPVGAIYSRTDGLPGAVLYVKERGTGTTGWAAK